MKKMVKRFVCSFVFTFRLRLCSNKKALLRIVFKISNMDANNWYFEMAILPINAPKLRRTKKWFKVVKIQLKYLNGSDCNDMYLVVI